MEKAKVVKVWPEAHVEFRLHVSERMKKDFNMCIKPISNPGKLMKSMFCEHCSWKDVKIAGETCCGLFTKEIRRQLEE